MNEQNIIDKSIYNKNLKTNQEKIAFWKFLMYGTKAEVHINSIQALLYWVSIMELFLFALGLALFISSPNNFAIFWAFITHVVRAILGLILLKRLPGTHLVIEELKEYEDSTIQDVENNILQLYKNMLSNNEKSIGRILLWYFIFTIIDIIMDNIVFFYLQQKWSNATYGLQNFFALILIVANFLCNGVYFSLFGNLRFNFPVEMRKPITMLICGYFTGFKDLIVGGIKTAYNKVRGNRNESNAESSNENNAGEVGKKKEFEM